eukprot:COSAG05_NODE_548_length_8749_cov_33.055838_13_plen_91_part_00
MEYADPARAQVLSATANNAGAGSAAVAAAADCVCGLVLGCGLGGDEQEAFENKRFALLQTLSAISPPRPAYLHSVLDAPSMSMGHRSGTH